MGEDPNIIQKIAEGDHPFSSKLQSAKKPLIIVGADALERSDGAGILSQVQLLGKSQCIPECKDWKAFNILHKVASQVSNFRFKFIVI